MSKEEASSDFLHALWKFFTSVKLTVILLLSLAGTSIIGTLIPQNESQAAYVRAFGEFWYRVLQVLNFFDMYHSWWFQALLLMVTANVVVCSLDRWPSTWKILRIKTPIFSSERFRNASGRESFSSSGSPEGIKEILSPVISRMFSYSRVEPTERGFVIFAEKGRWGRLGVYTVHLSVVLLLLGGLIGSMFGFDGFVNIPEGEAIDRIQLRNTGQELGLGFSVRCDDFDVSFYESGTPKEFRSKLTILEGEKEVLSRDIIVNDPLRHGGINFFQSSYGTLPSKQLVLEFTSKGSGMSYRKEAKVGEPVEIPEGHGVLVIKDYRNQMAFSGHNLGESFVGVLTPKDGKPVNIILPIRFPAFDRMRKGEVVITVADYKTRYYTGLQVTRDPGVWIVYLGFVVMIAGCFITFFVAHERICLEIERRGEKTEIAVSGTADKNFIGMENKVKKISEKLAAMIPA